MGVNVRRGSKLPKGDVVAEVKCKCPDYFIVNTDVGSYGLYLSDRAFDSLKSFVSDEFLKRKFVDYKEGHYFSGKRGNNIYSAHLGPFPEKYGELLDFCEVFGRIRSNLPSNAFTEIVYVEEYDLLLPLTCGSDEIIPIEKLVGAWMADGLLISVQNFEKLCLVIDWLEEEEIQRAVEIAGFVVQKSDDKDCCLGNDKVNKDTKETICVYVNDKADDGDCSDENIQGENQKLVRPPFVLPGREQLTKYFNEEIIDFFAHQAKYEKMGVHSVSATLLYGKPGCGKTYAVEQLAKYLGFPVFEINSSTVASTYIHETSKKIAEVFKKAMNAAPSVLILDEIEAYVSSRTGNEGHPHHVEEVDEFLRNIPKAIAAKVVIFAMTNTIDMVDVAVLRKGRFDNQIEVGMPSKEEIIAVLQNSLSKTQVEDNIDVESIAGKLLEHPLSDVAYVVRQAIRQAVRADKEKIDNQDLLSAVEYMTTTDRSKEKKHRPIGFATTVREETTKCD